MSLELEITGLEGLKKAASPEIFHKPVRNLFKRMAIFAQGLARRGSPVDTGRLRSSIDYGVDPAKLPMWARVYTEVKYAPYMEYGTGIFGDGPGAGNVGHWPPGGPLSTWAARHGFKSGYQVAAIIGRRGGLKPRRMFRNALEKTKARLPQFLQQCEREVEQEFNAIFRESARKITRLMG